MTGPPGPTPEVPSLLLAVDAGGSSTRAVLVRPDGRCLGYGLGAAGNPTSAGPQAALAAITGAAAAALTDAGRPASAVTDVLVALAGARGLLPTDVLAAGLGFVGPPGRLRTVSDILAMYHSGAGEPSGGAVVAGTGSVAARVVDGEVVRVHGGSGWLLGDAGSGFAVGHGVVRAVVGELDGIAPATALTTALLAELGVRPDDSLLRGRAVALDRLMGLLYGRRPVELARFAPLAFAAAGDPVTDALVQQAQDDVAVLVRVARSGGGPLVLGGGVMLHGLLAPGRTRSAALTDALSGADTRYARDGALGAAVTGLSRPGSPLDATVLDRLRADVAQRGAQVSVPAGSDPAG